MIQIDKNSVVVFGGSFDPVTKAHEKIVKELTARFGTAVVVPSFISPFKKQGSFAAASDRLAMLNVALKPDGEKIIVDDFELRQEGVSFTIDTIRHIKSSYPNRDIYIAIGSEMLKKLHKWHEFETLKALVSFYIINRPSFLLDDKKIARFAKKHEANIMLADFTGSDLSSSVARLDVAFGKFDMVSSAVKKHIERNNLYKDFAFIVDRFIEFNLSGERIVHIYNTALEAVNRAKMHTASEYDAAVAALLHDIAKESGDEVLAAYDIADADLEEFGEFPDKLKHAFVGALIAKRAFGIKKRAIIDAIKFHTSGAPKMGKLAKILFIADFSERGRDWEIDRETLVFVREQKNLNKAVKAILECKIFFVERKGNKVYFLTRDALEFYTPKPKAVGAEPRKGDLQSPELTATTATDIPPITKKLSTPKDHLAYKIATILDDKLGKDITIIDLQEKTVIADYFVIATATSSTAVRALTDYVDEELSKKDGIEPLRRDRDKSWAAIDYGSVIMHIQLPETRDFYNLERLWSTGENIEKF